MYTDVNGWVLSNRVLADLSADPGPGVVFASNYRGNVALDYCDGARLDADSGATVTVSYKMEPL